VTTPAVPVTPAITASAPAFPVPASGSEVLGTPDPAVVQRLAAAVGDRSAGSRAAGGPIRISRRSVPARVHPLINRGYTALKAGDTDRAQRAYREVLRVQPRNRDAILGMAAVSMQAQDWANAQGLYLRLLSLNPRDSLAQAAVISLQENVDPVQSEAMIRTLLRREPRDAFLHFSLGNLFAEQQRWSEAQQSFFDAHRLETSNADYVFNLAVALDQLTQPRTALDFYRRALELADDGYASFQSELVLARIQTLTNGSSQ
jgi:tetratricopeptide (TPR) repeat protein